MRSYPVKENQISSARSLATDTDKTLDKITTVFNKVFFIFKDLDIVIEFFPTKTYRCKDFKVSANHKKNLKIKIDLLILVSYLGPDIVSSVFFLNLFFFHGIILFIFFLDYWFLGQQFYKLLHNQVLKMFVLKQYPVFK